MNTSINKITFLKVMRLFCLTLGFLMSASVFGQKLTSTYSGKFKDGVANYTFYENDLMERIYHGKFIYNENAAKYIGLKLNVTGSFVDNLRDGEWVYSVYNVKSPVVEILTHKEKLAAEMLINLGINMGASPTDVAKMRSKVKNSIAFETYSSVLKGNYISGKFDGVWIYKTNFTGSNDLPINSIVNFKDNHFVGSFQYNNNKNNYVQGQFNNDGLFDGTWFIKWTDKNEAFESLRKYKNGVLTEMIERNLSTGDILNRSTSDDSSGKGYKLFEKAINFWLKPEDSNSNTLDECSILDRNYAFKIDRGIVNPQNPFKTNFISDTKNNVNIIDDIKITEASNTKEQEEKPYTVIEQMPTFPGGEGELMTFIGKNLKYPTVAADSGIQGKVIVRFIITKTGKIKNIEVLRSLDPSCDKEAVRVISLLPDWIPGKQNGQNVDVYFTLPISFKLDTSTQHTSTTNFFQAKDESKKSFLWGVIPLAILYYVWLYAI